MRIIAAIGANNRLLLSQSIGVFTPSGSGPSPTTPSLDFSEATNSMYVALLEDF